MEIIFMLIPIAMIFVAIAVAIFFWAVKSDQFEDLEREGSNILFDDEGNNEVPLNKQNNSDSSSQSNKHDK
ncbi:cbb3-type cytochrome oxidase assembly protein CcoS [Moritella marina ATCC 15381]|uniref:Cbb3-type cytochrome oxidase assembly protein CcoS n=1 Tax=Moritella marina ATCC 15381 TaxID=1202962 RepID=A0A5J6WM71_MORMI|nr:cbb3-type cytochrome oxidase assembly protein CcoS [Moritella marina]QFI37542.1 cbb3-type cytochrome oxidase assembly protein CcoS [Moritella marina ATCC 15381]